MEDGSVSMFSGGGTPTRSLGVYSGRINAQSDLGFVWRVQAIREIVEADARGV
jgi:hypothetical protein